MFSWMDERVKLITLRNLVLGLIDQGPLLRFFRNFFITGNARGLFSVNSHISQGTGLPKVCYNTKVTATKAALKMEEKYGFTFSAYKCIFCNGYHIGKSR